MDNLLDDLFGEPISVYTDAQALEDGVLIAVPGESEVNRVTRAVFDHFAKPTGDPAPNEYDLSDLLAAIAALLAIEPQDGWRTGDHKGKRLWLIPNEIGGLSL